MIRYKEERRSRTLGEEKKRASKRDRGRFGSRGTRRGGRVGRSRRGNKGGSIGKSDRGVDSKKPSERLGTNLSKAECYICQNKS